MSIRIIGPALLLVLSFSSMVSAGFTGVVVEPVDDPAAAGAGLQAFDLFVEFDSPADRLLGVVLVNLTASSGTFLRVPSALGRRQSAAPERSGWWHDAQ